MSQSVSQSVSPTISSPTFTQKAIRYDSTYHHTFPPEPRQQPRDSRHAPRPDAPLGVILQQLGDDLPRIVLRLSPPRILEELAALDLLAHRPVEAVLRQASGGIIEQARAHAPRDEGDEAHAERRQLHTKTIPHGVNSGLGRVVGSLHNSQSQ